MPEHHKEHPFYYVNHRLVAPEEEMEVSVLKVIIKASVADFDPAYTLVLEEHGDHPDRPLNDTEKVKIHNYPHFYSQPPATFG